MSKEYEDEVTAAEEFLSLIQSKDKKIRKHLLNTFLSGYNEAYSNTKNHFAKSNTENWYTTVILKALEAVKECLKLSVSAKTNIESASVYLGRAFGNFLAVFEFGFASENFNPGSYRKYIVEDIDEIAKLSKSLKNFNASIIRNRIQRILKKNYTKISSSNQIFIREMGAKF